jgi:hypothetical protein
MELWQIGMGLRSGGADMGRILSPSFSREAWIELPQGLKTWEAEKSCNLLRERG